MIEFPELSVLRRNQPEYADPATTRPVQVGAATIGSGAPVVIAGPCAIESRRQALNVARAVRAAGGQLLRGGAFKPRTNPHSFQGLGTEALEILKEVRQETGLGIVTEVLDPRRVEEVAQCADMLQIGSRSMQNFPLLVEVGKAGIPVLLKRGWSATLEEWLCAAEYIACQGNLNIVLCERGIRTACNWSHAQSVLDLNVLEPARRATPLPLIVDPSHATGDWRLVEGMSRAALAAGTHGLLIEVIEESADRSRLLSDADQGIPPTVLVRIMAAADQADGGATS
ncbi:MAG: 3-deoxy-7-phosphoheptulonate synthase [Acidobacteriota bacterium]|nr:3-deoxy-7-phosphoheptulonate synthase [Acidobacteriota bacterium]MDH3784361.1 3-deoxy-7-phosphoheptulonate synthase [Acidobacteriota bacterium]